VLAGSCSVRVALIDDDAYSADLLMRTISLRKGPPVDWCGSPATGRRYLEQALGAPERHLPIGVVIDLKARSGANSAFLREIGPLLARVGVPAVVMLSSHDSAAREDVLEAGAAAVFFRLAEREAYRSEVAELLSFLAHHPRLDAVGM
jgi:DNA-binding NarL/FixJ family response regulator